MDKPSKPSIPKGTRDFSPEVMVKRNYIFDIIKEVFCLFGYKPIETPSIENLKTLLGKYGEEGDRLIFKILNSGNFLQDVDSTKLGQFTEENARKLIPFISEKALRYDLTIPFARYVVQNQNEITFPFKRYQIQPVWRADRPQKGRYREFYQCDVDVIGSNSLLNELELIQIIDKVFTKLKLADFTVKLNNRKILTGISEVIGQPDKLTDITVAIDKIDKIGIENVNKELEEKGINKDSIAKLQGFLNIKGTNKEKLNLLRQQFTKTEVGLKGVEELETIFSYIDKTEIDKNKIQIDISLARGLNYYTGAIFEVKVNNVSIGSICGGGRYDDLTGIFGLPDVSGVGISFGADRIYDVMTELNLFPESVQSITKVLFINFGNVEAAHCLALINKVRNAGINAELYPEDAKLKKQMNYADKNKIPFVIIAGSNEIEQKKYTLKNMTDEMQEQISIEEIIKKVK